jgi:ketosteroid isomerase-like protein
MRRIMLAAIAAAALGGPAAAAESTAEAELTSALNRFSELVNKGDAPGALAYFVANPSITEDLAPYHWSGPKAGLDWLNGMAANAAKAGMTDVNMHFLPATMVQITGPRGYAVLPGVLTYTFKDGSKKHAQGHATFATQKVPAGWRIEALTWAWESEK